MLVLRGLVGVLSQITVLAALLLIPAGTWHWPRAIGFLVVFGLANSVSIVVLARLAPASLEARLHEESAPPAGPVRLVGLRPGSPAELLLGL